MLMRHKCEGCRYKGMHQEMGFQAFGVCYKETDLIKAERAYNAKKCPYKKTKTNADRIRAMSDEELADFLRLDVCHKIKGDNRICNGWCNECVLEWLKQPAEDGGDHDEC